jgi:hypothetical protein
VIRTQIQLTEDESEALKREARRTGLSVAELIRRSVDRFLEQANAGPAQSPSRLDALKVIGMFDSGLTDVSIRHDDYLVEAYMSVGS